ncbi:MAG: Hydroxyacylglutathione hydrolase [Alphaproteobacteria bacterium MarineAlpha11_Bin1]|nr:MAG: Hydroxyacylglutathione hydrolase [Alphaproteobacteria bacterium MarineAlpha11_Bin1]
MSYIPDYPFPKLEYGETLNVAPGIYWVRMPLPFALDHVNLWLLEDGNGWTVIDTGYNVDEIKRIWSSAINDIAPAAPIKRTIVTHFHPDHLGLAGWFEEKYGATLWMTYAEWLQGHVAVSETVTHNFDRWIEFYRDNGAPDEMTAGFKEVRAAFQDPWYRLPETVKRIQDNERINIGGRTWQIITGGGHSHEHASLWCEDLNVLISGDQILPRISSNISLWYTEPDGNPLRHYFESFKKYRHLPRDVLVLPSHDYPFRGLHDRLDDLRSHHQLRLDAALKVCAEPQTAAEVIPSLFSRKIGVFEFGFAIGETLAHLNYLVDNGSLTRRRDEDDIIRYRRVA